MEKKTLWIIGGGLVLLVLLYAATRSSGGTNTVSVVPASAPADPNVLAAQVQQDAIRGQIALATINAAGTIDAINAQSQGQVNQIDASYKGAGYLTKLQGAILSNLGAQQYTAQLGLAQIEGQTATQLAQISAASAPTSYSAPSTTPYTSDSTSTNRVLKIFNSDTQTTQSAPSPVSGPTVVSPVIAGTNRSGCWARRNIPIIGALIC